MPTAVHRSQPGSVAVKAAILHSATRLFSERGFAMTGVRDIAADAGVNPAIVIRHFGSKEELFVKTVSLPQTWTEIMTGPVDHIADRVVRYLVASRATKPGTGTYAALIRASDRPEVRRHLQEGTAQFVAPIIEHLQLPDAEARAHLFSAQLFGLINALWVSEDPVIIALPIEDVVRLYAPSLQSILTGR